MRSSALQVLALFMGLAAGAVLARLGGPAVKGTASAYAAITVVVFTATNLDLPQQALVVGRKAHDLSIVRPVLLRAWLAYLAVALLLAGPVAFVYPSALWVIAGGVALLVGGQVAVAANGVSGPTSVAWNAVIQQVATACGAALLWSLGALDDDGAKLIILVSYLAALPLLLPRLRVESTGKRTSIPRLGRLLTQGLKWQTARVAHYLLLRIDVLIVFSVLGAAMGGVYSVGLSTASLVGLVPTQMANMVLHRGAHGQFMDAERNARWAIYAATVASIPLVLLGSWLIQLMYGSAFAEAYPVLLACLPGAIAFGAIEVHSNRLRLLGNPLSLTVSMASGLLAMLGGMTMLIGEYRMLGAAIASSLGACTTAIMLALWARSGVPPSTEKPLPAATPQIDTGLRDQHST